MSTVEQKTLRRIRALLTQAEDPACTPEEAEAFSSKAEELIVRYAVDTAMLADAGKAERGKPTVRMYEPQAPYAKPKATLLAGIAMAHGCQAIRRGEDGNCVVVGFESDLALVDLLYTSLLLQGTNGATLGGKSYRTSFWYGFAVRVYERLDAMRQKASAETGAALVLADRSHEVDTHVAEEFGRLRAARRPSVRDAAGYAAGQAEGDRADLGRKTFQPAARAIG